MNKYLKKTLIKTSIIIFCILMVPNSLAAEVIVSTPNASIQIGQTFDININIDPLYMPVMGAQLNIEYNQSILKVNKVLEGDFFMQEGAKTYFNGGVMNNSTGIVVNILDVILGPNIVSKSGTFLIINATAIGSSNNSWINLSNVIISDTNAMSVSLLIENSTLNIMPLLSTLNVTILDSNYSVISNGTSQVTVHVTSEGLPVEGATVDASVTGGSLVSSHGLTDINGDFNTNYNAPNVTTSMTHAISATASKTGYDDGSGTYQITINLVPTAPFLNSINVTPTTLNIDLGSNQTFNAFPKDQFNYPYTVTVTWSSSNTTVGTIDLVTGKFTALTPGTVFVNATNGTVDGTAHVTVNPISSAFVISNITAASDKTYIQDKLADGPQSNLALFLYRYR